MFENRFMHVHELQRLGADIQLEGNTAIMRGVGQHVRRAADGDRPARVGLRWCWPGSSAEGDTTVDRIYHIDRGYENIEEKLGALGARIRRLPS